MPRHLMAAVLALLISPAQAMQTESVDPDTLSAFAATLAANASASQWQQLWQRTRQAGHFTSTSNQPFFSTASHELPALVATTLGQAQSVTPLKRTQARYRHDFTPQIVGQHHDQPLTAICIWVDWRSVAEGANSHDATALSQASLLLAKPCT